MKQYWRIKVFYIKHSNSVANHDFVIQTTEDTKEKELQIAMKEAYKDEAKMGNVEVKVLVVNV